MRDPSCRDTVTPLPTPTRERPILLPSTHAAISCRIPEPETHLVVAVGCSICTAHVRETHLATQYTCCHQLSHTQTGEPSCYRRRLLDLLYPAQLCCSTTLAFTVHRHLIYHFLQNLI